MFKKKGIGIMLNFFRPTENEKLQAAMDYVAKFAPNHTVVVEKKKRTWLIVLLSVVGVLAIAFVVYKFFFEDSYDDFDDFDDFDDDDYDEIFEIDEDEFDESVVVPVED